MVVWIEGLIDEWEFLAAETTMNAQQMRKLYDHRHKDTKRAASVGTC